MDPALVELVDGAWETFRAHKGKSYYLPGSMPILFFGDLSKYTSSRIKIITIGVNPSKEEFPEDDLLVRFPLMKNRLDCLESGRLGDLDKQAYVNAISDYFAEQPYQWFKASEHVLNQIDSSYYPKDGHHNTVLHTDFCTPLAVKGNWGKLTDGRGGQKASLLEPGNDLWYHLIEFLNPHIMIASVQENLASQIRGNFSRGRFSPTDSSVFYSISHTKFGKPRRDVYEVHKWESGGAPVLFSGEPKNGVPFGSVSIENRNAIGRRIKNWFLATHNS